MKKILGIIATVAGLGVICSFASQPADADKLTRMLQQSTQTLLKEGNIRFAEGKSFHPNLEPTRRTELAAAGQEPIATILACADSRAPVELMFDRGAGDLFVVRVAGNVAGLSELATIEYGVTHLGTPVLVVLGHSQCGAVTAATKGAELHGHLPSLVSLIKPAADKARVTGPEENLIPRAIELNVWQQVQNIFDRSALIREHVAAGKVVIVGAIYDIVSGKVQWLGPHPEMERFLAEAKAQSNKPSAPVEPAPASAPIAHAAPPSATVPAPVATPVKAEPPKTFPVHPAAAIQKSPIGTPMVSPATRPEVANTQH